MPKECSQHDKLLSTPTHIRVLHKRRRKKLGGIRRTPERLSAADLARHVSRRTDKHSLTSAALRSRNAEEYSPSCSSSSSGTPVHSPTLNLAQPTASIPPLPLGGWAGTISLDESKHTTLLHMAEPAPVEPSCMADKVAPTSVFEALAAVNQRQQVVAMSDAEPAPLEDAEPQIFLMNSLSDLLNDVDEANSIVVFDIDETLIMTRHMPSFLLSDMGVKAFQQSVARSTLDINAKNQLCRNLATVLHDKVPVESCTAMVVRALQNKGCHVFGLTARDSGMMINTQRALASVGIDLSLTAPFPRGQVLTDSTTEAVCTGGIVYCGDVEKGVVLSRLLPNVIVPELQRRNASCRLTPLMGLTRNANALPFSRVYFVDDRYDMCESVWRCTKSTVITTTSTTSSSAAAAAAAPAVTRVPVSVSCYHYQACTLQEDVDWDEQPEAKSLILRHQIATFATRGVVLSNAEAASQTTTRGGGAGSMMPM